MNPLEINISDKLNEYIQELVDDGNFESSEAFVKHAVYWLAELYGFGEQYKGKSLSALISVLIGTKVKAPAGIAQPVKTATKPVAATVQYSLTTLLMHRTTQP